MTRARVEVVRGAAEKRSIPIAGDHLPASARSGPPRFMATSRMSTPRSRARWRAGLESICAPEDRPYGERAGFVKDRFGNHWYIATAFGASYVPEGRRTVTPFLHVRGGAALIDFLTRAFGAVEVMLGDVRVLPTLMLRRAGARSWWAPRGSNPGHPD